MNPEDRQLLDALNLRQERLETAIALLKNDLVAFGARLETSTELPPLPEADAVAAARRAAVRLAPEEFAVRAGQLPAATVLPPLPRPPEPAGPGLEIQFGRWLARIGVVFALLTLIFFSVVAYQDYYQYIGPWTKLGVLTLVSAALIAGGTFLERSVLVYGRTLAAGGMACLYYTLYGATYVGELQVNPSPLFGGLLLLAWSACVLVLAERRKSELLSVFALSLAYFSSAITPVGNFTMAADLLLALTAVVFLVRNAWTGLSYLCLIGTYLGFIRQIVVVQPNFPFDFDLVRYLAFWPSATYLTGAWLIFTAGIFLAKSENFLSDKRMTFLCLNNGAGTGLLLLASQLSHYGHTGKILLLAGTVLAAAGALARLLRRDLGNIANAYLAQGLAVGTAGIVTTCHEATRGLILTAESVGLVAGGTFSRNVTLRIGGGIVALLGTAFLFNETARVGVFPWWLTAAGAAAMLANAWLLQWEPDRTQATPGASPFRGLVAFHIALALALIVRWVYGVVPDREITLTFLALGTALLVAGAFTGNRYLVRAALTFDLTGAANYLFQTSLLTTPNFTWPDATAFVLFLAHPIVLRHANRAVLSQAESWLVVLLSTAMAWLFVSNGVESQGSNNLTLAWGVFALALIILGFAANERRQRWGGLGILVAAIARVAMHDFWSFSDGYKVLTFFVLTVICLGLSFLYYKFADRLKEWL